MKAHMNVPIFIPHLGCPHSCVFCNQHSVTHIQAAPSPESVALYIQKCLANKGNRTAEVAFFGGSFTGLPLSTQAAYLAAAAPFAARGEITGIRLSTRPDFISSNILDFLREHYVKHIELGAQSMCDAVLTACGRGHTAADTVRASALILEKGFVLGLQMMTGLPGSTPAHEADTARAFVRLGATEARIYPTVVFRDTALYTSMQKGQYVPQTVEEAVSAAAEALFILESGGVHVLRIGLQETETLGGTIAGGAYHPAIGELIRARRWRIQMEQAVAACNASAVTITFPAHLHSQIVGQHRENICYLEEKYKVKLRLVPGKTFSVEG